MNNLHEQETICQGYQKTKWKITNGNNDKIYAFIIVV